MKWIGQMRDLMRSVFIIREVKYGISLRLRNLNFTTCLHFPKKIKWLLPGLYFVSLLINILIFH